MLSPNEIEELWNLQPTAPFDTWSKRVLGNMWGLPMLLFLLLLTAQFEKTIVISCLIVAIIYLTYGLATAMVCAPWRRRRNLWIKKSTFSILLLIGFNAISLSLISIVMIAISLIIAKKLFINNINLSLLSFHFTSLY